uniref:TRM5/TYW2-like methyltransferase domain-containing protein n=1 Tax=Salmo trutta TaxID=8032 RepID=A0A674D364_SALTR
MYGKFCSTENQMEQPYDLLGSHGERWTEDLRRYASQPNFMFCVGLVCVYSNASVTGPDLWPAVAQALGDGFRSWKAQLGDTCRQQYQFDVTRCMFSAGNITEKLRVASFNCSGETGIGYFTIPFLVHAGASHVHACEWNPDAVEALQRNLGVKWSEQHLYTGDQKSTSLCDLRIIVLGVFSSSHCNVTAPHHITDCDTSSVPVMERVDISGGDQKEVSPKGSDREVWGAWTKDTAIHIASLLQDITGGPCRTGVQHIEHVKSYTPHIHHIVLFLECRPL